MRRLRQENGLIEVTEVVHFIHTLPDERHGLKDLSIPVRSTENHTRSSRNRNASGRNKNVSNVQIIAKSLLDKTVFRSLSFWRLPSARCRSSMSTGKRIGMHSRRKSSQSLKIAKRMKLPVGEKDVRAMLAGGRSMDQRPVDSGFS